MNAQLMTGVGADRNDGTLHGWFMALTAAVALLLGLAAGHAADPGKSAPAGKDAVMKLEGVPGSAVPRVILTAKAAERLGIQTGKVGEESVVRKQMVSGLVIPPMDKQPEAKPAGGTFGGFGKAGPAPAPQPAPATAPAVKTGTAGPGVYGRAAVAAAPQPATAMPAAHKPGSAGFGGIGQAYAAPAPQPVALAATAPQPAAGPAKAPAPPQEVWVLVTLSPAEWERLAKDKPARLLPLATREKSAKGLLAEPSGMEPLEDHKRSMLSLYYKVPGTDHGLAINNRMRVELQISGSEEAQKTVPYSSVYYDGKGKAWVYVNPKPLTYERQPIAVERVVGDLALLSEGPPVGTPVVTVGAALLYGAEIFKK